MKKQEEIIDNFTNEIYLLCESSNKLAVSEITGINISVLDKIYQDKQNSTKHYFKFYLDVIGLHHIIEHLDNISIYRSEIPKDN